MKKLRLLINIFIKKLGYIPINTTTAEESSQYAVLNFTLDDIFNFFPRWVSKFHINDNPYGGQADYTTTRISMLNERKLCELVDFTGKTIIEFGPLEGGNTIILQTLGVKSITAIEGHMENYVRCCVIKNLFALHKATFHFDTAMNATVEKYGNYDIALVAGLFYHLDNPHIFLKHLSNMTDTIVLSTHYADEESPSPDTAISEIHTHGHTYKGKLFKESVGPNSGLQSFAFWPFREDLFKMLTNNGYLHIHIVRDSTDQDTKYKLIYLVAQKQLPTARKTDQSS